MIVRLVPRQFRCAGSTFARCSLESVPVHLPDHQQSAFQRVVKPLVLLPLDTRNRVLERPSIEVVTIRVGLRTFVKPPPSLVPRGARTLLPVVMVLVWSTEFAFDRVGQGISCKTSSASFCCPASHAWDAAFCARRSCNVGASLSVTRLGCAVQKRLNIPRSCLRWTLLGTSFILQVRCSLHQITLVTFA